ncbi:EAL domain-containing protein [Oxalobacteraceae bacterium]|nr:EAL domain-containing protein [Oxalobacteraceae bacterium]
MSEPISPRENLSMLAAFIRKNVDAILDGWEQFAKTIPISHDFDTKQLRDHCVGILHTIAADLDRHQTSAEQTAKSMGLTPHQTLPTEAALHGAARALSGFDVSDTVSEFRALRASVLSLWSGANPEVVGPCLNDMTRFNEAIDQALSESLRRFAYDKLRLTQLFDALLSSTPDLNFIFDKDGMLIYANKAFIQQYHVTNKDIGNTNFFTLFPIGGQELRQQVTNVLASKTAYRGDLPGAAASAAGNAFEVLLMPVLDRAGNANVIAGTARDVTARKAEEESSRRRADVDPLTDLPNRSLFLDRLETELKRCARAGMPLALLFLDLDGFKDVNDRLGHGAGDQLLQQTAQRIRACVRDVDTVARLGGDEFTIILAEVRRISHVEILAQHILGALDKPYQLSGSEARITGSIGITLFPQDGVSCEELIRNADQAMYTAKNAGRNQFSFYTAAMRDAAWARLKVIDELRRALSERQLLLYYQPIIELATGRVVKGEAQLRWQHPRTGMIRPADFIALAEETGLIGEIGEWVVCDAANRARTWSTLRGEAFQIWIHRSAGELSNRDESGNWGQMLNSLAGIGVEINEHVLVHHSPLVGQRLKQLRAGGVELILTDFATGNAAMAYLQKFDITYLRIDHAVVQAITRDPDSRVFVEAMIAMAHKLGIKLVAEGVETAGQKDWLTTAGCDYAQGYLISPPLPASDFEYLLKADTALSPNGSILAP